MAEKAPLLNLADVACLVLFVKVEVPLSNELNYPAHHVVKRHWLRRVADVVRLNGRVKGLASTSRRYSRSNCSSRPTGLLRPVNSRRRGNALSNVERRLGVSSARASLSKKSSPMSTAYGNAGAPVPATSWPGSAPARPRTAPRPPARTVHRPGRSGRHGTLGGTAAAGRVAQHWHPLASCPSRPSLVIMVLWREHMITRRPYSRTTTRQARQLKIRKTPMRQPDGLKNKLSWREGC